jgi:hypothetical protein
MIRFAWLQARTQALVAAAALVILAAVLLITAPGIAHLYDTIIKPCSTSCSGSTLNAFLRKDRDLRDWLNIFMLVVPGIIGVFWGAPLVARELETGTHRLAWAQSVTRTRWLAVKLGVMVVITVIVTGLMTLMFTWWNHLHDRVEANVFGPFDARDIVPVGYAVFALVLGVTAGLLIRKTVAAMATVFVLFTAVRVTMTHWVRPHLFTPMRLAVALDPKSTGFGRTGSGPDTLQPSAPRIPNAWIISTRIVDASGHALTPDVVAATCPAAPTPVKVPVVGNRSQVPIDVQSRFEDCVTKIAAKYHTVVSYHPASRYWAFQFYELAIYLGAAAVLAGLCILVIRRRRS